MQMTRPQAYGGYRVMIVDDEPSVLAMARSVLLSVGFPVISASSGEMAVAIYNEEFFAKREISLVILDLTLPSTTRLKMFKRQSQHLEASLTTLTTWEGLYQMRSL